MWIFLVSEESLFCCLGRASTPFLPLLTVPAPWSEQAGSCCFHAIREMGAGPVGLGHLMPQALSLGGGGQGSGVRQRHPSGHTKCLHSPRQPLRDPYQGDVLSHCPWPGSRTGGFTEDPHFSFLHHCPERDVTEMVECLFAQASS